MSAEGGTLDRPSRDWSLEPAKTMAGKTKGNNIFGLPYNQTLDVYVKMLGSTISVETNEQGPISRY